ncbi:MAG: hypothetical protein M3R29_03095 [Verrucomicrobiota bacterium]|nr:hypothetical protein [Verrucomicrobiota bacterium]
MSAWIEPPPAQQGMGCFAKGCLILLVFCILLGLAFIGGTFYAVRYLRSNYFPTTYVQLPATTSTEEEQQLARAHWKIFENAARAHAPARIEMTARELNALIASEPRLRGKAYVSIDDNVGHVQLSIPLDTSRWLRGHFVNGECTVTSASSGSPAHARITNVVVNGHTVDEAALAWRYPWSLRGFLSNWTEENNLKTFEISDGKVILESKGGD